MSLIAEKFDKNHPLLVKARDILKKQGHDNSDMVRKPKGRNGTPFRYAVRTYFEGSEHIPEGVKIPGQILLVLNEQDKLVDAQWRPALSMKELHFLDDYLNSSPHVTREEQLRARAKRKARMKEIAEFGERVSTAHKDEKLGRALANLEEFPELKAALLAKVAEEAAEKTDHNVPKSMLRRDKK